MYSRRDAVALALLVSVTVAADAAAVANETCSPVCDDVESLLQSKLASGESPLPASGSTSAAEAEKAAGEPLAFDSSSPPSPFSAWGLAEADSGIFPFRQPMINHGDVQYVSSISLGNQEISGILDTGSFELVVFGTDCQDCNKIMKRYNQHDSGTFEEGLAWAEHSFGSGSTMCEEAREQVGIGPYVPVTQTFWYAKEAQQSILQDAAFSAIIGVAPPEGPAAEAWTAATDMVDQVLAQYNEGRDAELELIENSREMLQVSIHLGNGLPMASTFKVKVFSVCLGTHTGSDGVFIWEDTAVELMPDLFVRVPVTGHHSWSATLAAPRLLHPDGNYTILSNVTVGQEAIIDTGTSLLGAPENVVQTIAEVMERLNEQCSNLDILPDLEFTLGGHSFTLPPTSYVAKSVRQGTTNFHPADSEDTDGTRQLYKSRDSGGYDCVLMISSTSSGSGEEDYWILGLPFFRKYYTSFSYGADTHDRAFFIAEHGPNDCLPQASILAKDPGPKQQMMHIDESKIRLPVRKGHKTSRAFKKVRHLSPPEAAVSVEIPGMNSTPSFQADVGNRTEELLNESGPSPGI